jgi:signal transduction histidine kinase/CheY-like chemotaxis protein
MRSSRDTVRVLHVDDDSDFGDVAATFVERVDDRLEVETVTSASKGLDCLAEGDFECVVSDYDMPEQTGIEFLESVRQSYPELPFILFTGKGSEKVASEAISTGATDYLQKASGTDLYTILANRITNAVEQYRTNQSAVELERIHALASKVKQTLVRADSRQILETRICEIITESDPYRFAWIGEVDPETDEIRPRSSAGTDDGYLEAVTVTAGQASTGQGPGGRAVQQRCVAVAQNVQEDPEFDPWREHALERGFQAVAAIPLEYDETLYGVLGVYADRPYAFDETETDLLAELGDDIAHGIHSLEIQKQRRKEQQTTRELQQQSQKIIRANTVEDAAQTAVEIAKETLGLPVSGVHLVTDDVLEPIAVTDEVVEHLGKEPRYDRNNPSRSIAEFNWGVFEDGDPIVINEMQDFDRTDTLDTPSRSGIIYPLDDHGLFITTSAEANAFSETDRDLVELLATILTAVLDRSERETELRRQKQRLQVERDRLDEFAGMISHDLRNPLNVADLRIELVREECDSDHIDAAARAVDRMESLIDDLLTLARAGEVVSELKSVRLDSLIERCWQTVTTAEATVVIETDRTIRADQSRFKQLLENLIRNAVEHGGDDVVVTVGELDEGFYIEDDGPGIPTDERDRIFDSGYSTDTEGAGLGLVIVQKIAAAHGWEIAVTESDSGGARFEITGVEVTSG